MAEQKSPPCEKCFLSYWGEQEYVGYFGPYKKMVLLCHDRHNLTLKIGQTDCEYFKSKY